MKAMKLLFISLLISMAVALFWNSLPFVKEAIHFILDPSAGTLLNYNVDIGMILISAIITLCLTLVQKYTTDQKLLKEIKAEQKLLSEEMKKYKDHPEKLMELNKKQLEFLPRTMDITMRPLLFTSVPIILFIRWFNDYFVTNPTDIFGFMSWFWAYFLLSIIFSMLMRKVLDVA